MAVGVLALLLAVTPAATAEPAQCVEFPEGQGSESVEAYYQPEDVGT